jgi:hypothetical protein
VAERTHVPGLANEPRLTDVPPARIATAPRLVRCVDMRYRPAAVVGRSFHPYLILDLFGRKMAGWKRHDSDDSIPQCTRRAKGEGRR